MEPIFLIIVIILFLTAVADLVVGVSNDAVNFLNSAIGSRAGSLRKIMIIATAGVILGSVFSSGMMEVARKGVFNPQFFTLEQIMFLFAAVMLTDIILLNFYNTIALPTSTTVSIVFELLGSALAISFIAVVGNGDPVSSWGSYINGSRALIIITGIFVSVVIAFLLGWAVQYITRLIVSFNHRKSMRGFGSIFGAASVALIIAFIVLKGLNGIPMIGTENLEWIKSKAGWVSLAVFVIAFLLFQVFIGRKDFSVYRFVTLLGTFALAMAFASNDLVNFVGVPIAGFDSYMTWKGSGLPADQYMMDALAEPVPTKTFYLLIAGIIMAVTLWFSKKARSVVQTSLNLGRQDEGAERFHANEISRGVVRGTMALNQSVVRILPQRAREWIAGRFDNNHSNRELHAADRPSFDMVRASVNLIVAAGIILLATSLKLPLSTTYVTFMVLMGTSLADRAWGSGSAVYRVSGMLTVIGGWFLTALIALTVSILFASLLMTFRIYALAGLVLVAVILVFRGQLFFGRNHSRAEVDLEMSDGWFRTDFEEIEHEIREKLAVIVERISTLYIDSMDALLGNNRRSLSRILLLLEEVEAGNELSRIKVTGQIREVPPEYREGSKLLMLIYDLEQELLYALGNTIRFSHRHVTNIHSDLQKEQRTALKENRSDLTEFFGHILEILRKESITANDYKQFKKVRKKVFASIEAGIMGQIDLATSKKLSGRNSELILTILLSSKNMAAASSRLVKLFYKVKTKDLSDLLDKLIEE